MGCLERYRLSRIINSPKARKLISKILFLLLFISFSLTQMYGLLVLLLFFIVLMLAALTRHHISVSRSDFTPYFFCGVFLINFYGIGLGFIRGVGADVLLANSKVFIFYPVVGFIIALLVKSLVSVRFIRQVVFISGAVIILINLIAIYSFYSGVPVIPSSVSESGMLSFSIYDGRFILNSLNIASIPILFPFILYFVLYHSSYLADEKWSLGNRLASFLFLVLFIVLIAVSGRRGIWISSLFSFVALYSISSWYRNKAVSVFKIVCGLIIAVSLIIYFDMASFYVSEFNVQSERSIQAKQLLGGFFDFPLGNGIGSVFEHSRNKEAWIFELTWHKLLADVGVFLVVLSLFFMMLLTLIFKKNRRILDQREYIFSSVAIIAFAAVLIASATNPYILNLDGFIAQGFLLGVFDGSKSRVRVQVPSTLIS